MFFIAISKVILLDKLIKLYIKKIIVLFTDIYNPYLIRMKTLFPINSFGSITRFNKFRF